MKLRYRQAIAAALLLATTTLWAGCDSEEDPTGCTSENDCATGLACVSGACTLVIGGDVGSDTASDLGGDAGSEDTGGQDTSTPDMADMADMAAPDLGNCSVDGCADGRVCNPNTGACQDCEFNEECGSDAVCDTTAGTCSCATGFHDCAGTCVSDTDPATCGTSCDPCATDPNGVSSCNAGTCELACNADLVLSATKTCVECADNSDCDDVAASTCTADACVACTQDADCSHLAGTGLCNSGTCVACTAADDSSCGANSCDGSTNTCTSTPKASVAGCKPCLADSECGADHLCVPMSFNGTAIAGGFCLQTKTAAGACAKPFPIEITNTSIDGAASDTYCGVDEALTTCTAVLQWGAPCASAAACGEAGIDDALCEPVDFDTAKCTFACTTSAECPSATFIGCATGSTNTKFCGGY